jgi:hypothetical protein
MTQRERRALLQRLPPAPIAQQVYPHAAGDTCQEAEAVGKDGPGFTEVEPGPLSYCAASPSETGLATNSSPLTLTQRR